MRIFYYTFGCKVNQYETENIRELFEAGGNMTVTDIKAADVCIVNSCTVTSEADKKCRQFIHKIKRDNPDCVLVCAGCMTQAHENIADQLPECDIIVGSANKTSIPTLVEEYKISNKRIIAVETVFDSLTVEPMCNNSVDSKTRAYIKIQDGCDMHCSYCIIPKARGHIRSKPIAEIIAEAQRLIGSGHKELILTGINLCCYGRENGGALRLIDAIEAVCNIDGDYRVRLSSLEPELISENDIERMAALTKLCHQFHLSLQSGCDRTLKAMNRHYTSKEYAELCTKLRKAFDICSITTDIMVGFPGETEDDHRLSMEFAQQIGFSDAHVFPFSPRPDTPACYMNNQIDGNTKKRRAAEMTALCKKLSKEYLSLVVGSVRNVLFERESDPRFHQGHTSDYILVKVKRITGDSLRRQILPVRITSVGDGFCYGELTDCKSLI